MKMPSLVKEMVKLTEPLTLPYNFVARNYTTNSGSPPGYGVTLFFYLCIYNDSSDISLMHNALQTQLNQGSAAGKPLNKFAVGKFRGKYELKNTTNIDCVIDMYHVVARNDMDTTLCPTLQFANSGPYYADLYTLLKQGYAEESGASQPATGAWPNGVTPYNISKFCTYYKIIKHKEFKLIGGDCKTITIKDSKWRIWNGTKVYGCTGALNTIDTAFAKRTHWYFGLARGFPVTDASSTGNVSTGPVNLAMHSQETYNFTGLPNATRILTVPSNNYGTISTLSTIDQRTEIQAGYVLA